MLELTNKYMAEDHFQEQLQFCKTYQIKTKQTKNKQLDINQGKGLK
jgi:hypothetical protein